jgi:hypothetical protein
MQARTTHGRTMLTNGECVAEHTKIQCEAATFSSILLVR